MDQAVAFARQHRILSGGYTLHIMQEDGVSVVLEISPGDMEVIHSEKAYLYNTRFVSARMRRFYGGVPMDSSAIRAEKRLRTFERLLQQEAQPYTLDTMKRVLSDHSPEGPIWDWTTPIAVAMFPRRRSMLVYEGPPDVMDAEEYSLTRETI